MRRHALLAAALLLSGCQGRDVPPSAGSDSTQAAIHRSLERVYPALVMVSARWDAYDGGAKQRTGGTGSGTIIDPVGHVLTNFHVAGRADVIRCQLYNKEFVSARLVGADPWTDLALLQLDTEELARKAPGASWAPLGHSESVRVGDQVLAMGAPLNQARSVSFGVVSNTERMLGESTRLPTGEETGDFNTWIQTDASINPGNSGGPLVDMEGRVIGINSRKQNNADGIGFAVPVDIAREVVYQIMAQGRVRRATLGLDFQATQDLEQSSGDDLKGALIRAVDAGSAAAEAGVRTGDLLLQLDGRSVSGRYAEELFELRRSISALPVGREVDLLLRRAGKEMVLRVQTRELGASVGEDKIYPRWGLSVKALTERMCREMNLPEDGGLLVTGVRSTSAAAGLLKGDVIMAAGADPVATLSDLDRAYSRMEKEKLPHLRLQARRKTDMHFVSLRMEASKP